MRFELSVAMVVLLIGCQKQPASETANASYVPPEVSSPPTSPVHSASTTSPVAVNKQPFVWPQAVKTREELLKTGIFGPKWTELTRGEMKLAVAIDSWPTSGESYIDVYGYVYNLHFAEWRQIFAVKLRGAGHVAVRHDEMTGMLSVHGAANNDLNGKPLFSFDLNAVHDDRAYLP